VSNTECIVNLIDLVGFDAKFTKRIMNGETSMQEGTMDKLDKE
jgi:hypothetical protein